MMPKNSRVSAISTECPSSRILSAVLQARLLNTTAVVFSMAQPEFCNVPGDGCQSGVRPVLHYFHRVSLCHDQRVVRVADSDRAFGNWQLEDGVVHDVSQERPVDTALQHAVGDLRRLRSARVVIVDNQDAVAQVRPNDPLEVCWKPHPPQNHRDHLPPDCVKCVSHAKSMATGVPGCDRFIMDQPCRVVD